MSIHGVVLSILIAFWSAKIQTINAGLNTGSYVIKSSNQLCTNSEILQNEDECRLAASLLVLKFRVGSSSNYPTGCFTYGSERAYWNSNSLGSKDTKAQLICKAETESTCSSWSAPSQTHSCDGGKRTRILD